MWAAMTWCSGLPRLAPRSVVTLVDNGLGRYTMPSTDLRSAGSIAGYANGIGGSWASSWESYAGSDYKTLAPHSVPAAIGTGNPFSLGPTSDESSFLRGSNGLAQCLPLPCSSHAVAGFGAPNSIGVRVEIAGVKLQAAVVLLVSLVAGVAVFLAFAKILQVEEAPAALAMIKRRFSRGSPSAQAEEAAAEASSDLAE
jgi:hypothetical protein